MELDFALAQHVHRAPVVRAIVIEKFGGPDALVYTELPEPGPVDGQVVIRVKAFGDDARPRALCDARRPGGLDGSSWRGPISRSASPREREIDAVLDLVGNSTTLDSLAMLRRGGAACLAGWLGGLAPIADFNPLLQIASGVYLTFFGSFGFGTPGFPLSDVPLQSIADDMAAGRLKAKPSRIFTFEEVRDAHRVMEANEARGKTVAVVGA
jgi:NADPH:quinone reductase-like Zn-dependent oxidoreductase